MGSVAPGQSTGRAWANVSCSPIFSPSRQRLSFPARVARLGKEKCKRESVPSPCSIRAVPLAAGLGVTLLPAAQGSLPSFHPLLQGGCCTGVN